MYILHQRLQAQNIPTEKTMKVLYDIAGTMFNSKFMDELFKPQELYSKKALRTVFDRLAHSSIMKLNTASMDKLYDLMTMAVKHQTLLIKRPQDILCMTLNHLDVILSFVEGSSSAVRLVENIYSLIRRHYASLTIGSMMLIRQTLLGFFQDIHIRVSIFLRDKVQTQQGKFVLSTSFQLPVGIEVPGKIRLFNSRSEKLRTMEFNCGGSYTLGSKEGSLDLGGDRVTTLGLNMYSSVRPSETSVSHATGSSSSYADPPEMRTPDPRAKAQLDFLCRLIGGNKDSKRTSHPEFKLNLFNTEEEEDEQQQMMMMSPTLSSGGASYNVVNIDASKKKRSQELSRIMGDMNIESSGDADYDDDDLLDLMDSAK